MLGRMRRWGWQMLKATDQWLGCWLRGWTYVWLGGELPDPGETISSWVGRRALAGKRWALIAQSIIDAMFGAGHCRGAIGS